MTAAMSWELDDEHEEFRASARSFVDRHVRPVVDESEEAGRPPAALLKEMVAPACSGWPCRNPTAAAGATPSPSSYSPRSWPGPAVAWPSAAQAELLLKARGRHEESPDAYWTWVAERQRWMRPWDTVRTGELGDFSYFGGGLMNVADNCVDRWAEDPATADRAAVIWEGEPGDVRTISYAELADEVSRLAAALASLGVAKGDVVAICLPNAIEAFTAVHACNRIGAVYTILFSGFGPDAVRSRLKVSQAKAVVVLDASYRRGKFTPLLDTLRAARAQVATVEHTIVVDRTGRGVPLQSGEISYVDALALVPEGIPAVPLEANDPAFLTSALPKTRTGKIMRRLLRDVVEHGQPQGDTSAMEDVSGLRAVQQAVAAAPGT